MGAGMALRLVDAGHGCIVHRRDARAAERLAGEGATGPADTAELCVRLEKPRAVWIMAPVAVVESVIGVISPQLEAGDIIVDGGNPQFGEDIRHAERLADAGIRFLDCGTGGGVGAGSEATA
jgi:6-phosphogluconate dehydrogenase